MNAQHATGRRGRSQGVFLRLRPTGGQPGPRRQPPDLTRDSRGAKAREAAPGTPRGRHTAPRPACVPRARASVSTGPAVGGLASHPAPVLLAISEEAFLNTTPRLHLYKADLNSITSHKLQGQMGSCGGGNKAKGMPVTEGGRRGLPWTAAQVPRQVAATTVVICSMAAALKCKPGHQECNSAGEAGQPGESRGPYGMAQRSSENRESVERAEHGQNTWARRATGLLFLDMIPEAPLALTAYESLLCSQGLSDNTRILKGSEIKVWDGSRSSQG